MGSELRKHFPNALCPSHKEFDVTVFPLQYISKHGKIGAIIHCAAMTDTKECEENPMDCYMVNSVGTFNAAYIADIIGAKLVYISTDYVFDGKNGNYKETDTPNPQGHYAKSKLIGEWFALSNPNNLVIRTNFMRDFKFKKAFSDKYWSGEWVEDIAKMIYNAINMDLKGLYHVAGARKSIHDLVKTRYPKVGKTTLKDNPVCRAGFPYLKDTSLDCSKFKEVMIRLR